MASLYSVIPGLVPTSQEIIEAELLAKQVLEGKFPDLDLREGTGLRDLVLRPTAYAFALLKKANDYYFAQNTLSGVDDTTPTEMVDDILSNWFLERNTGTYAVINARLYFARQKNVSITTDISFSPDNALEYFPEEGKVYTADALSYDAYTNEWYLDVFLRAANTGSEYNVNEGSLLYFTNFDPYFLRAEINYLAEESTAAETNQQFISRAATAISTRNLINIPSVESRIRQVFNYVSRVVTVGAGDPDMIRDMIRVVFDPSTPYAPEGATVAGELVTLVIGKDVFLPGQNVDLANAVPTVYNGRFTIVDTGPGTITVRVPGNPGFISQSPTVTLALEPLFIHDGGKTDVFCCDRLATSIVQVTTDANGVARVEGPVYKVARSEASGGNEEDTIPLSRSVTSSTYSINATSRRVTISSIGHGFSTGPATIQGLEQHCSIGAISCTGLTVTATAPGHGATVGSLVTVSGVTPAAYNGTYTVTAVSGNQVQFQTPSSIQSIGSGMNMRLGNGSLAEDATITATNSLAFEVYLPYMWTNGTLAVVSGTATASVSVPFTLRNPYTRPLSNRSIRIENGLATVLSYNHGYSLGRRITILNSSTSSVNGSWRITAVPSGNEIQFEIPALKSTALVETTGDLEYVDQRYDYGFSSRQVLEVDFGPAQANKTASFELSLFRDVESLQAYLESPDNRVLCGDYLARGFNLHLLDIEVVTYNGPAASTATIQSKLEAFLAAMAPGEVLVISEMVLALGEEGITNIRTPIGVKYTRYTRDLTAPETGEIVDYLDPNDKTNIFLIRSVSSSAETV